MFDRHHGLLQAMFASSIPEIIELVGSRSKYSGELKREHGKRYQFDSLKRSTKVKAIHSSGSAETGVRLRVHHARTGSPDLSETM